MKKIIKKIKDLIKWLWARKVKREKLDVKGGQMTYSQRVVLSQILTDQSTGEFAKFKKCIACLHPKWKYRVDEWHLTYFQEIVEGIVEWSNKEQAELSHKYKPDEIMAGFDQLGSKFGSLSVADAMGQRYSVDPDAIYGWKYGKVFNLLLLDNDRSKAAERLRDIQNKRANSKQG